MGNKFALILTIILFLASASTYVYLTLKIHSGDIKIAVGQEQLKKGQQTLAEGKAKLAAGRQKLGGAQKSYKNFTSIPFMGIIDKIPLANAPFTIANSQITEGSQKVAKGRSDIAAGEARLKAGQLDLSRGQAHLAAVNRIRIACGIAAILFTFLIIVLGFYWRRSRTQIIKRK